MGSASTWQPTAPLALVPSVYAAAASNCRDQDLIRQTNCFRALQKSDTRDVPRLHVKMHGAKEPNVLRLSSGLTVKLQATEHLATMG